MSSSTRKERGLVIGDANKQDSMIAKFKREKKKVQILKITELSNTGNRRLTYYSLEKLYSEKRIQ
jgi:hypothetical protein